MPDSSGRLRATIVALIAASLVIAALAPLVTVAHDPPGIDRFMDALGQVESGGNYTARNSTSGAYGKYQIMPANWPSWAGQYLGDPNAAWTPANQDAVARGKLHDLYEWLGAWNVVAHWWLTGSPSKDVWSWSAYSRAYVDKVMALYGLEDVPDGETPIEHDHGAIAYAGDWIEAFHPGYRDGAVHSTDAVGATAMLTFIGSGVTWYGPVGPTRGQAKVYVDGTLVQTVNTHAATYRPRTELFSIDFGSLGRHTLLIEALGTDGHPTLAIDVLGVRDWAERLPFQVNPVVGIGVRD